MMKIDKNPLFEVVSEEQSASINGGLVVTTLIKIADDKTFLASLGVDESYLVQFANFEDAVASVQEQQ